MFLYQNLTDTDSTSLIFVFVCKLSCSIEEEKVRNIIFEVLTKSKIIESLDLSDDFWEQSGVQNKNLKNQVGLYEVENIENTNILTIAINPRIFWKVQGFFNQQKTQRFKKEYSRNGF